MPSAVMCAQRWKAWVAALVYGPKIPSVATLGWLGLPASDSLLIVAC
jgi:hypothetical protein